MAEPFKVPTPAVPYKANDFSLRLYEDWQDKTLYTITGPVTDDIQHNTKAGDEGGIRDGEFCARKAITSKSRGSAETKQISGHFQHKRLS